MEFEEFWQRLLASNRAMREADVVIRMDSEQFRKALVKAFIAGRESQPEPSFFEAIFGRNK